MHVFVLTFNAAESNGIVDTVRFPIRIRQNIKSACIYCATEGHAFPYMVVTGIRISKYGRNKMWLEMLRL